MLQSGMQIICLENKLNIMVKKTNHSIYDYSFELFHSCKYPSISVPNFPAVFRIGAIEDYPEKYNYCKEIGIEIANSVEQHRKASELTEWYSKLSDLTPYTKCYENFPPTLEIAEEFGWPIFVKGSRQTSRHSPELSIARNEDEFSRLKKGYLEDATLHWQNIAIRKFIELQPVNGTVPGKIKPSMEFRSFWWNGECVGVGQYWYQVPSYNATDLKEGVLVAQEAATRLKVPFLVIDFAKTLEGNWIIIECNDAQESGFAGIKPQLLWRNILELI